MRFRGFLGLLHTVNRELRFQNTTRFSFLLGALLEHLALWHQHIGTGARVVHGNNVGTSESRAGADAGVRAELPRGSTSLGAHPKPIRGKMGRYQMPG